MAGIDQYVMFGSHFDGADASTSATDFATNQAAKTITFVGNAQIDTAQSVFGGASILFDGTGDFITLANSDDFDMGAAGAGDFTVDFRLRFAAVGTAGLFTVATSGASEGWSIYYDSDALRISVPGSGTALAWTPSQDTWYHVAVDRFGSTLTGFIDGTSLGTFTDKTLTDNGHGVAIGSYGTNGATYLNGWIDEIRVTKGFSRYQGNNFTPATEAYSAGGGSISKMMMMGIS